MKILFVSTNRLKRVMPPMPLGLASVIAQIDESRHQIRALDLMFLDQPDAELKSTLAAFKPDMIALSIRNIDNQCSLHTEYFMPEAKRLVELCRENSNATIVIGGPAFTVTPIAVFEYLKPDFGIAGEGELAFPQLVDRLERKADWSDVPGLIWRTADSVRMNPPRFIEDLDSLRPPRRELFDNQRYASERGFGNIVVKQGCGFRCLYCDSPHTLGHRWRTKSPEKVVDELESMEKLGINVAFFSDPIFNCPLEHAKEVCRAMIRRKQNMRWVASFHPAHADRELLELMRDSGCVLISLGCDTCSEKMLKIMRKDFTKEQLGSAMDMLEQMEINYLLSLLVGAPGEDRNTIEETIEFLNPRKPFFLDFCVGIRLMPHTALFDIAVQEGVISADDPLMEPKFYISPAIEDWIEPYLTEVCARHSNWSLAHLVPPD